MKKRLTKHQIKQELSAYYKAQKEDISSEKITVAVARVEEYLPSEAAYNWTRFTSKQMYLSFFFKQARLVSVWTWLGQLLLAAIMLLLCLSSPKGSTEAGMLQADLSLLAAFLVLIGVPSLCKNKLAKMGELEGASFHGLASCIIARLIVLGAGAVTSITLMCLACGLTMTINPLHLVLGATIPYFICLAGTLSIVRQAKTSSLLLSAVLYNLCCLSVLFLLLQFFGPLFWTLSIGVWIAIFAISCGWIVYELHSFIQEAQNNAAWASGLSNP